MRTATKVLRVGIATPLTQLDPRRAHDAASHIVLAQVFETPYVQASAEDPPQPQVLSARLSREQAQGNSVVYSASVRADLVFSDGTPVTPEHVVDSLSAVRVFDTEMQMSTRGQDVLFTLPRPVANFEFQLAKRWCAVLLERGEQLLGTGPFMFAQPGPHDAARLVRSPRHRNEVALDEIVFSVYLADPDGRHTALLNAIATGNVHYTPSLPREEVNALTGVRKLFHPGDSTAVLYFNNERPPLADLDLRRALTVAIDRYELARACHPESPDLSARGILPPKMRASSDGIRYDPQTAKELIASASTKMPSQLRTVVVWGPRPYMPRPRRMLEELDRMLRELGVQIDPIFTTDPDDYYARITSGDYDCVLGGWIADSEDPVDFVEATFASTMIPVPGRPTALTANLARHDDPKTDSLLHEYRAEPTSERQQALLDHVMEQAPLLPLMHGPRVVVHTRNVLNVDPRPFYTPSFAAVDLE